MRFAQRDYVAIRRNKEALKDIVVNFFKEEGFRVTWAAHERVYIVQASKGGVFRPLLGNDRSFTVLIEGNEISPKIKIGIMRMLENPTETEIRKLVAHPSSEYEEIPESLWTYEMEHHLWHYLETEINLSGN